MLPLPLNFVGYAHLTEGVERGIIFSYKTNAMTEKANPKSTYRELSAGEKTVFVSYSTHSIAAARKSSDQ